MSRIIGYARVSTDDQDLTLQLNALKGYGIPDLRIFAEHASGKNMKRKELKKAIRQLRNGDTLVVWKLDRLGRDLAGVLETIKMLDEQDITLVSLTEQFDTNTPMGKAFLQISLVFAELERNMTIERTKAGLAVAKAKGKRFGRTHSIRDIPKRIKKVREMDEAGQLRSEDGEMKISAQNLMDILNAADKKADPINNKETVRRWWRDGFPGLDDAPST